MDKILDDIKKAGENQLKEIQDLNKKISKDYIESYRVDIEHLRNLIVQLIIISATILGIGGAVLSNKNLIKNEILIFISSILLASLVVSGFVFLLISIENSIIRGWIKFRELKDIVNEQLENLNFLIKNPEKHERFNEKNQEIRSKLRSQHNWQYKRNVIIYIQIIVLAISLILIFLSLFNIKITRN